MKKVKCLLLLFVLLCTMLTACSMPDIPFLNKDKDKDVSTDEQPTNTPGDGTDRVFPISDLVFNVGDTITVNDLVTIDETYAGDVLQSVILYNGAPVAAPIELTEAGVYTYTVMIEFLGDVVYSGDIVVDVAESAVSFPTELNNNLVTKEWECIQATKISDDIMSSELSDYVLSYAKDDCTLCTSGSMYFANGKPTYQVGFLQPGVQMQYDPTKCDYQVAPMLDMLVGFMGMTGETDAQQPELNVLNYFVQFYNSAVTVSVQDMGLVLYDSQGQGYPIMGIAYTVDFTAYGDKTYNICDILYADINGGRLYFIKVYDDSSDGDFSLLDESVDISSVSTYDDFVQLVMNDESVRKSFVDFVSYRTTTSDAANDASIMSNSVLIGDSSNLSPKEEPGETVVDVPNTPEEDVSEESGVVGDVFTPYNVKHPYLYTWAEDATKYRRWVYTIDDNTQYVSSIIYPDGTQQISGENDGGDWRIDVGTSGNGDSATNPGNAASESYTLSSQYSRYNVKPVDGVTLNQTESTSGRLSISYGNAKFFIETIRPAQVQQYLANSLYPMSNYKNNEFTVYENVSDNVVTNIGTITPYTVRYISAAGKETTCGYMAVYNISNDYLCIYSDTLPIDMNVFVTLLKDMVSK